MLIPRTRYTATDTNPLYLQTLASLTANRSYMQVSYCDVTDVSSFPHSSEQYDTVICLNVIENVADDRGALGNIKSVLSPSGRAIIVVPRGPQNMGTLDEVLGHRRRYTQQSLRALARDCRLTVVAMLEFNRFGSIAWFLNGKIMKRRAVGLGQMWILNMLTPILRRLDSVLPLPPLTLIAVLEQGLSRSSLNARETEILEANAAD